MIGCLIHGPEWHLWLCTRCVEDLLERVKEDMVGRAKKQCHGDTKPGAMTPPGADPTRTKQAARSKGKVKKVKRK